MKVVSVVGARPQFVKAVAVSSVIDHTEGVNEVLVHTGQHYSGRLSDIFFDELDMTPPAYNLGVGSGSHGAQTGRMLEAIEQVLMTESPDLVLVYGDTNSTLAGALAGVKLRIPVAHVEAGLRSFNRAMPEEINRVLTDHAADLLFAPTDAAVANLAAEGLEGAAVHNVGDIMYDVALTAGRKAASQCDVLARIGLESGGYVLATVHRAENTDDESRLRSILDGLNRVAEELPVVLPLHPRTRKAAGASGLEDRLHRTGMNMIEPVGYLDMAMLEQHAAVIATDSGGVQKEAFFHRVPCATLRSETEWVELVDLGWNRLIDPGKADADGIAAGILSGIGSHGRDAEPYGQGDSGYRIVQELLHWHRSQVDIC